MRQTAAASVADAVPQWSLGDRLRKSRGKTSQTELAFKVRKSPAAIGAWENDINRPDMNALEKWASATGVPLWWILGFDTDPGDEAIEQYSLRSRWGSHTDLDVAA